MKSVCLLMTKDFFIWPHFWFLHQPNEAISNFCFWYLSELKIFFHSNMALIAVEEQIMLLKGYNDIASGCILKKAVHLYTPLFIF